MPKEMKKFSSYFRNIYSNRCLDKVKSCKKRSCYFLICSVINFITLSIVPTRKMLSAITKIEILQAFNYWL